ncbi:MAG: hypothetical protein U0531_03545 [Dehalococcoidia bacterium]
MNVDLRPVGAGNVELVTDIPAVFGRYRAVLDAEMRAIVGGDASLMYRIVRYHLGWEEADGRPGRGRAGRACARCCACSPTRARPAAAS